VNTNLFSQMTQAILDGDPELAESLAQQALESGLDPLEAINQGYVPGLDEVGAQFSTGEMFLPDLVLAAEAMKAAIAVLEPAMAQQGRARQILGTVVIGTIEGDIHDIGKTLVATMLAASGFAVHDLGVNVPIKTFIETAQQVNADLIGASALLTTTMVKQRDLVNALEAAGLRSKIKVMVGGAPVTAEWVTEIGADGFSRDAIGAVQLAKTLVTKA
jgi:corrinoid protein of di/trimethylamine methyltransferase